MPIKGCKEEAKDLILYDDGCKINVKNHINDVDRIFKKFEEVDLILFIDKFMFGFNKIIVVEHLCKRYGKNPNPDKVDDITRMKAHSSITKVGSFW